MATINLYIIIPSLFGGGSERVILNLIKYIDKSKFNITLVLGNKEGDYVNEIPNDVRVIDLKKKRVRHAIIPIIFLIRKQKPDLVLSTLGHLNLLMALFIKFLPKKTKFIARESNTISIRNKDESYPKIFDFLFKTIYKNFDFIICQANSMKKDLKINYGIPVKKMIVINNPIDHEKIDKMCKQNSTTLPSDKKNLLIVGRLSFQKRIDHAIKLIATLPENYHLTIVGVGELKAELKNLINQLKVKSKVSMLGFVQNPYVLYKKADCLLSTSRYEGFPNVVIEANACGTPVIAYNYTGGINEIIIDKVNGQLIENGNIDALTETVINTEFSEYNRDLIRNLTIEKYNVNTIVGKYQQAFLALLNQQE